MSGGYLRDGLETNEQQIVIFTFKGPIDQTKTKEWNDRINALKQTLGKDKVVGVTFDGKTTPDLFRKLS